uniref:Uncharacterized protein n=1 Tax=Strigamia maritima TaxID=126957 RepID=T1JFX9_STRMM
MDENMPSTSRKRTGDKISGSGFMNQKIKHSKVKNTIINIQHLHQPATTSQQQIRSCCDTIDDEGNKRCTVFKKNLQELIMIRVAKKYIIPKFKF